MFHRSFLVKKFYLDLNFFQTLYTAVLKNEIKVFQKWWKSSKYCVDIARHISKTLKKRKKTQNEKKSNNSFLLLLFLYRKIYILLENIFEKT